MHQQLGSSIISCDSWCSRVRRVISKSVLKPFSLFMRELFLHAVEVQVVGSFSPCMPAATSRRLMRRAHLQHLPGLSCITSGVATAA